MKNKIRDSIATLFCIAEQAKSGNVDQEEIAWIINNSNLVANQMDLLLGIVHVSTGYTSQEIEDCVMDMQRVDVTLH
jgi:hypothetical protein